MIHENPTDALVKDALDSVPAAGVIASRVTELILSADPCGFVTWDSAVPVGGKMADHHQSFTEAFLTALAFCDTDMRNEWIVAGQSSLAILRLLPAFQAVEPVNCGELVYVGKIDSIIVYACLKTSALYPMTGFHSFFAGNLKKHARGSLINDRVLVAEHDTVFFQAPLNMPVATVSARPPGDPRRNGRRQGEPGPFEQALLRDLAAEQRQQAADLANLRAVHEAHILQRAAYELKDVPDMLRPGHGLDGAVEPVVAPVFQRFAQAIQDRFRQSAAERKARREAGKI